MFEIIKFNGIRSGYGVILDQRSQEYKGKRYKTYLIARVLGKNGYAVSRVDLGWVSEYWFDRIGYEFSIDHLNENAKINFQRLEKQVERYKKRLECFVPWIDKFQFDQDLVMMKQFEGKQQ